MKPLSPGNASRRSLLAQVRRLHAERFGRRPDLVAFAPGRIEVLGNHTDYNEGLTLSAALEEGVAFAVSCSRAHIRLYAAAANQEVVCHPGEPPHSVEAPWSDYIRGVMALLAEKGVALKALDATIAGNLPIGAGLSSSAALEVSSALALARFAGLRLRRMELARLCRRAEWEYAGVRCGLLDQMTSLLGRRDHLLHIDFRTLRHRQIPFAREALFIVCTTPVRHRLADSLYNTRREECDRALVFFSGRNPRRPPTALRDVTPRDRGFQALGLDAEAARRARHVVAEIERVRRAQSTLSAGDLKAFGRLMLDSHRSSRTLFENSTEELDFLVGRARHLNGVWGARLSGAGFGGNVLVAVAAPRAAAVAANLNQAYRRRFDSDLETHCVRPARGASLYA